MKKLFTMIMAFVLMLSIGLNVGSTIAFAKENEDLKVEEKDKEYFNKLIAKNEYLKRRVEELKKENFNVDTKVKSVRGFDFVYYNNADNSITGLIEVHDELTSEMRVNSIDMEPNTIEFIKENGAKMILGKDENGMFNDVIYKSPEFRESAWWCPYVVGLVGTSIGTLYTTIAGMIGGPIAAVIVAGVNSVGWTYVSQQC